MMHPRYMPLCIVRPFLITYFIAVILTISVAWWALQQSVASGANAVKDIPQNHPKSSTIKPLGCSKISKKKQKTIFGLNPHSLLVYLIHKLHEVSLMNLARCSGWGIRWTLSMACCDCMSCSRLKNFKMSHSSCQLVSLYKLHGVSAHLSCSAKVTAVLVEGALANAANDKELSRHDMKQKARQLGWKGNARETFQDISRYFKKPVEQLWSSNIVNITVYHGTSKVAVPLDTLTNPGDPHVLIETGWDWRPSRNWKSTQKMKSRGTPTSLLETGDPHVLFTKGVSILTIWQVRKFAPKVMQVSWWHHSRKVFVSVVFVVTPCSARNLMKFAVQKKTSLAGPPQKKEHVFFQSLLRRSFVEICWGSHVSTSKSRVTLRWWWWWWGLCRDWRGWFRNDWPPRAAWPFQKSQRFVTSERLKVRLHDSGSRIRFVLLLSGFGTRNKLVFCGDSTPSRMLRVSKINLDQLPIELNSEHVSSLEDLLFVNALWKVPIG